MKRCITFWLLSSMLAVAALGQRSAIQATLQFQVDSLQPGQVIPVELRVVHPQSIEVVFPNHSANFRPFELVDVQAEPSQLVGNMETDVAVYTLRSFDIAERQFLRLRFGEIVGTDTNWTEVVSDTIFFARSLPGDYKKLEYQTFDEVVALTEPPNYRGLITVATAIVLLLGFLLLVLRRPIRRYLEIRSLNLEWQGLRRQLKKLAQIEDQRIYFPAINTLWKSYLDPDEKLALRSLTTTELRTEVSRLAYLTVEQQQILIKTASAADQVIYAGHAVEGLSHKTISQNIRTVLQTVFEKRKKALLERKKVKEPQVS